MTSTGYPATLEEALREIERLRFDLATMTWRLALEHEAKRARDIELLTLQGEVRMREARRQAALASPALVER